MIRAYLDESGIHDGAKVCVIGGYFAGEGRWRRFESEWKGLLAEYEISMERFHAAEFLKTRNRFQVLKSLADLIASHERIRPITAGIIVNDFYSFSLTERKYLTGGTPQKGKWITPGCPTTPYFVPFQRCIVEIAEKYVGDHETLNLFFGLNSSFAKYAGKLVQEMKESAVRLPWKKRLGATAFPPAKQTPQLQAADLLVHLTYQHMLSGSAPIEDRPPGALLKRCIQNRRSYQDFFFLTRENMEQALVVASTLAQPPRVRVSRLSQHIEILGRIDPRRPNQSSKSS